MRALVASVALWGCTSADIDPMERQPKLKAYGESELFADGRAMRQPPEGTVARERVLEPSVVTTGNNDAGAGEKFPMETTRDLLARGRSRFDIYCAVCHGFVGDGRSVVADKMSQRLPPSLHEARIKAFPPGQLYRVISEGWGLMPSYKSELTVEDRWAVVAYVRALQLSQSARLDQAPADVQSRLGQGSP